MFCVASLGCGQLSDAVRAEREKKGEEGNKKRLDAWKNSHLGIIIPDSCEARRGHKSACHPVPAAPYQDCRSFATFQSNFQIRERSVHLIHVLVAVVQVVFRGHDGQLVDVVLKGKARRLSRTLLLQAQQGPAEPTKC